MLNLETALRTRSDPIGTVTSVAGCAVKLGLRLPGLGEAGHRPTVGRYVGIRAGTTHLVGVITELGLEPAGSPGGAGARAWASLDLLGELVPDAKGERRFRRGVGEYPAIGDAAEIMPSRDLGLIYQSLSHRTATVGSLQQDASVPAVIDVDDLLSRHFAVLGATGVGKSSAVTLIIDGVMRARRDVRVFLVDVHNEYGRCFGSRAHVVHAGNLKLPFWMLNFEELVDVLYAGRPSVSEETEVLLELIPIAKSMYDQHKVSGDRLSARRSDPKSTGYTVDTPVPFLLQDLITLLDERMGRLENRASRMTFHRLMTRVETIRNDPRYAFMFENAHVGGDMMGEIVSSLFRLSPQGRPLTVFQLGGIPSEAADAVVCALARIAFEFGLWSDGAVPLLFVCEEAHRYASADQSGFSPSRRALSRIAKEGRKNGVYLGLVTQRPAELDPTIISQCGTLFAMRMANEHDQALLRSAVSDGAANLLAFVPSLGTREAIGFGEGMPLPARMVFDALPADRLPRADVAGQDGLASEEEAMRAVIERWRGASMSRKSRGEEPRDQRSLAGVPAPASPLDVARSRLLKRSLELGDAVSAAGAPFAPRPLGLAADGSRS